MKYYIVLYFLSSPFFITAQQNLDTVFKKANITGVQLLVSENGQEKTWYYGKRSADETARIDGATVFQAASLSKLVLAYITMRLADRKIISLDTPLYRYYVYERIKADTAARKITARMVLHHTSGFPNWASNPTAKQWHTSVLKTNFTPGSSWSYSGEGFMYLQFAVESVMKKSLEQIAREEVFIPLKMPSSSFLWRPSFADNGAYGHDKTGANTGRPEPFLPAAAYSLLTTAADYNRFLLALITGKGLSNQMLQLMLADAVPVKKPGSSQDEAADHISWGLGAGIQKNEAGTAIWHWGDNGDFKCFFMVFPAQKKSLVYFTNSANGLNVMQDVLNFYFGKNTWWALQWLDKEF
ncbi:MAG: serine hydrolase domain-containing protein [Chitinophagaceae bacterium]